MCVLWGSVLYCVMSAVWESQASLTFRCSVGGKAVCIMWVKKEGVILTSVPYAHVLYRQYRGELCPHCCLVPPSPSIQCGGCGEEYCSRRCLQAAAPIHALECSLLVTAGEPEDPTAWLLLRSIHLKKSMMNQICYLHRVWLRWSAERRRDWGAFQEGEEGVTIL